MRSTIIFNSSATEHTFSSALICFFVTIWWISCPVAAIYLNIILLLGFSGRCFVWEPEQDVDTLRNTGNPVCHIDFRADDQSDREQVCSP